MDGTISGNQQQKMVHRNVTPPDVDEQLKTTPRSSRRNEDIEELMAENDQLRRIISEMEKQHQQEVRSTHAQGGRGREVGMTKSGENFFFINHSNFIFLSLI